MYLSHFNYYAPQTAEEILSPLIEYGEKARILAGGTDLLVMMKDKLLKPECIIDISGITELAGISFEEGAGATIGAGTKIAELEYSKLIEEHFFCLHQAAGELGSAQVRAMATIGGNSCHASPAAETPPPLIALGARVKLQGPDGSRELPLEDFILGNRKTALKAGEFLRSFFIPEHGKNSASRYQYLGLRSAMEIDMVNVAIFLELAQDCVTCSNARIVMGSVSPVPLRAVEAEAMLVGNKFDKKLAVKVGEAASREAKPITDLRASAEYRKETVKTLVTRTLLETFAAAVENV